jgi:hypothetical protein
VKGVQLGSEAAQSSVLVQCFSVGRTTDSKEEQCERDTITMRS